MNVLSTLLRLVWVMET